MSRREVERRSGSGSLSHPKCLRWRLRCNIGLWSLLIGSMNRAGRPIQVGGPIYCNICNNEFRWSRRTSGRLG